MDLLVRSRSFAASRAPPMGLDFFVKLRVVLYRTAQKLFHVQCALFIQFDSYKPHLAQSCVLVVISAHALL
jgi:hypothetical protein